MVNNRSSKRDPHITIPRPCPRLRRRGALKLKWSVKRERERERERESEFPFPIKDRRRLVSPLSVLSLHFRPHFIPRRTQRRSCCCCCGWNEEPEWALQGCSHLDGPDAGESDGDGRTEGGRERRTCLRVDGLGSQATWPGPRARARAGIKPHSNERRHVSSGRRGAGRAERAGAGDCGERGPSG